MSSLTHTAHIARNAIAISGVVFILIVIGAISWQFVPRSQTDVALQPTPTPETLFGKLPPVSFPPNETYPSQLTLQTIEGGPPVSTASAFVYLVPDKEPNLFSRRNAEAFAQSLGFDSEPIERDDVTLVFEDREPERTLTIHTPTNNYSLRQISIDQDTLDASTLPADSVLITLALKRFQTRVNWDSELTQTSVRYLRLVDGALTSVSEARDAQLARVDFRRPTIDGFDLYTDSLTDASVYMIFTVEENAISLVVEESLQNFTPSIVSKSTYPTISGVEAWEKLTAGGGYILSPATDSVTVREGSLAYFQETGYHPYIQPVYVFEGDGDFVGIVPAIDPLWIGN